MAKLLLDTEVALRLMRAERKAVTRLRRSSAKSISISSVTMTEQLDGARLSEDTPSIMAAVRAFLKRIYVHIWDGEAVEAHTRIHATAKRSGGSAGACSIMIAAHAEALGMTLVTSGYQEPKNRGFENSQLVVQRTLFAAIPFPEPRRSA
jgi:tRNA(fMet)-specific endonuclease VapC